VNTNQKAEKFIDDDTSKLIIPVQEIMTGLRTAFNEEDKCSLNKRAVHGLVMQK
jgi:hypothetical protein